MANKWKDGDVSAAVCSMSSATELTSSRHFCCDLTNALSSILGFTGMSSLSHRPDDLKPWVAAGVQEDHVKCSAKRRDRREGKPTDRFRLPVNTTDLLSLPVNRGTFPSQSLLAYDARRRSDLLQTPSEGGQLSRTDRIGGSE